MCRAKLLCIPSQTLSKRRRNTGIDTFHLRQDCYFAVAPDELNRKGSAQQSFEGLPRHWTRDNISADHDPISVGLRYILKDRFQGGKITVNIVESRDAHRFSDGLSLACQEVNFDRLARR